MTSTIGVIGATTGSTMRSRADTSPAMSLGMTISTTTAIGVPIPTTAMSGFHASRAIGLLIERVTGHGSIPGDGPGSMMSHGATRHFIMVAGYRLRAGGDGSLGP